MNKVILIGNLGKDPEVKTFASGNVVCEFSLATRERKKDGDNWVDATEWHKVVVWGKRAENCGKYLSKGSLVAVDGKLETQEWKDKDGNKRWTTKVVAFDVRFLSSKNDKGGSSGPSPHPKSTPSNNGEPDYDDVPF